MKSENDDLRAILQHAQQDLNAVGPEVGAQPQKGWWERFKDGLIDRFVPEVGEMLMQKTAQGAAEISHALNSQSNAYTPYGYGQQPLSVEGPMQDYQDMLREASQRAVPQQSQELER
jgi:hypothetical protein